MSGHECALTQLEISDVCGANFRSRFSYVMIKTPPAFQQPNNFSTLTKWEHFAELDDLLCEEGVILLCFSQTNDQINVSSSWLKTKKKKNRVLFCLCPWWCPPSWETFFQGWGGYMKAAFWIWSLISSSSLNGKVPLRLQRKTHWVSYKIH